MHKYTPDTIFWYHILIIGSILDPCPVGSHQGGAGECRGTTGAFSSLTEAPYAASEAKTAAWTGDKQQDPGKLLTRGRHCAADKARRCSRSASSFKNRAFQAPVSDTVSERARGGYAATVCGKPVAGNQRRFPAACAYPASSKCSADARRSFCRHRLCFLTADRRIVRPFHTIEQTDPVYDGSSGIIACDGSAHQACSVELDLAAQAMRLAEGFVATDVRLSSPNR